MYLHINPFPIYNTINTVIDVQYIFIIIKAGLHATTYCTFYRTRLIVLSKKECVYSKLYVLSNQNEIQDWIEKLMGTDYFYAKLNDMPHVNSKLVYSTTFRPF
jgi:hypothetical protein